jgi:hypothetical protein
MELVEKNSILAEHPGVRMAQCSRLPCPLALDDNSKSARLLKGIYAHAPAETCALSVLVVSQDYATPRVATIGGFVCINNEFYGLTTAHVFEETKEKPTAEVDLEFFFYDETESDNTFEEDEDFEMTSKGCPNDGA